MKIKKVSICGFKSFMDKMDISFTDGIVGVVGPNGCGKSNVVDAIRWCMGEQSPKLLRGRKMEDLIFSGAGDFKPLGMAEVSLLFENGNGSFPPAFANDSELAVTRRLYRSGESEYLINHVPCRLKDIQEIFMDTGLGNRAYSIIGQGQIGTIIDQKPEETRVMLEEAAGITKYRRKAEISQKKIEMTEANLQRVDDVLNEVLGQIRSLKRQAAKARRYKDLSEEIRQLDLALSSNAYHQLMKDLGQKRLSTEALVHDEIAASGEMARIRSRIEEMQQELDMKDETLAEHRQRSLHLRDRVHKKEADIESLSRQREMLVEMKGRLEREQQEIAARLDQLGAQKEALQEKRLDLEERAAHVQKEMEVMEERLQVRKGQVREIKEEYEDARQILSTGENRAVGLDHESGYLKKLLDQVSDSRSRLKQEQEEAASRMHVLLQAFEKKNALREALSQKLAEVLDLMEEESRVLKGMEEEKVRLETDLRAAEKEQNLCKSRLASLETLTENFEGYKAGVRSIMKATEFVPQQQGRVLGILADMIQVAPRYERAVESVLADRLQYVLVESLQDAREAVLYLREKSRGMGSFVPMEDLRRVHGGPAPEGPWTPLVQQVATRERYRPLLEGLLNGVLVVENLEQAISCWKEVPRSPNEPWPDLCFVTLEGELVDSRGVVSGGGLSSGGRGILMRKREMEDLKRDMASHEGRVQDLQTRLEGVIGGIQEKKLVMEGLDQDRWDCQEEMNEGEKAVFRLGQEVDQLEKLTQKIAEDLHRKQVEEEKHQRDLGRIEEERRERRDRHSREEAYFRKKEQELKEAEQELEHFREEATRLKADQRIIQEERRSAIRETEMMDGYVEEGHRRLGTIGEELLEGQAKYEECQRRTDSLSEERKVLYADLSRAEEALQGVEQERKESQYFIREQEGQETDIRSRLDDLREQISRAKMEHSEIQIKMSNLVETVREKFNLDLSQIYEQMVEEHFSRKEVEEQVREKREARQRLGEVNLMAIRELDAFQERHDFIVNQREDLLHSIEALRTAIRKINKTSLEKFKETFEQVNAKLKEVFPILFNGGTAGLKMTDESQPLESGVLVEVHPPGKRLSHMGLLSGGEKALVAMALLFAIYMIKPSPFCLMDEVDAPLDEANTERFNNLLQQIRKASQIIMVTHSRKTMEIMDRLYGVTMERKGISKLVSVDMRAAGEVPVQH